MLTHNLPWQGVLAYGFVRETVFVAAMLLSVISGYFDWWVPFTVLFLTGGFFIIIQLIPVMLNLSRTYFVFVASKLLRSCFGDDYCICTPPRVRWSHRAIRTRRAKFLGCTVLQCDDVYDLGVWRSSANSCNAVGHVHRSLSRNDLYGSIRRDDLALVSKRISFPKRWHSSTGNRRHRRSLGISRMRVRTITGKERQLPDWVPPPQPGDRLYYDKQRGEWLPVTPDTELPENALVMGVQQYEE